MKKNILIAIILMSICLVCALGIAGVNALTAPIIEANQKNTNEEAYKKIFEDIDLNKSTLDDTGDYTYIIEILYAKDRNGNELGEIYSVSGKNSYGIISMMVGLKDGVVVKTVMTENGQSFAKETEAHFDEYYANGVENIEDIDVKSGATYASILMKNMVTEVLNVGGKQ